MQFIDCKDISEGCKMAAGFIIKLVSRKNDAVLALPTGNSPLLMYKVLVEDYQKNKLDYSNVVTFNLDEYYQIAEEFNDQSYASYMQKNLFQYINLDPKNIHFPYKEGMKELDVEQYDQTIESFNGLDLCVLGVGRNGHIAFNEPNSELNSTTRIVKLSEQTRSDNAIYFDNDINNVPTSAATMGIKTILQAKKIILLAFGENKKQAIDKLKENKYDPQWPVTALVDCDNLIVITDLYYNK